MLRRLLRPRQPWIVPVTKCAPAAPVLIAALALVPAAAAAQQVVQPGSVHHQNVQTAIKFLRDHGETEAADQIQELLDAGRIQVDPEVDVNGETSFGGTVSLSPSVAGHTLPFNRGTPLDPDRDFQQILELARTLYHENVHVHQSYLNWLVSVAGENTKEVQAWRRTLQAMERWIEVERKAFGPFYRHKVAGTPPAIELRELEKIKIKMRTLDTYYGDYAENDYYGANDAASVAWSRQWLKNEQETHLDPRIDTLSNPPAQTAGEPARPSPATEARERILAEAERRNAATPQAGTPEAAPQTPGATASEPRTGVKPASGPVPCLPCQPIAKRIGALRAELQRALAAQSAAMHAHQQAQAKLNELEKQIAEAERIVSAGKGQGGRSYDPATGVTIDAWDQGDGTVKVTVRDRTGRVVEERTRDASETKAEARRRLDRLQDERARRQADVDKAARQVTEAEAAVRAVEKRLSELLAELADCLKTCSGTDRALFRTLGDQLRKIVLGTAPALTPASAATLDRDLERCLEAEGFSAAPQQAQGGASSFSGSLRGHVRERANEDRSVLLGIDAGYRFDEVLIEFPNGFRWSGTPVVPDGWTVRRDGRRVRASGPAVDRASIRLDVSRSPRDADKMVGKSLTLSTYLDGRQVGRERAPVTALPKVELRTAIDDILTLPPRLTDGPLLGSVAPEFAEGTWTLRFPDHPFFASVRELQMKAGATPLTRGTDGTWTIPLSEAHAIGALGTLIDGRPGDFVARHYVWWAGFELREALEQSPLANAAIQELIQQMREAVRMSPVIGYTDRWGETLVQAPFPLDVALDLPSGAPAAARGDRFALAGQGVCVGGWFPDERAWFGLTLDGQPLVPLAASGRTAILGVPGEASPGSHTIAWTGTDGAGGSSEVTVLGVEGSIDQNELWRGQSTTMRLQIVGSAETVPLEITNRTPATIQVDGGVRQVVSTSGGAENLITRSVRGIRKGDFVINFRLDLPACAPR